MTRGRARGHETAALLASARQCFGAGRLPQARQLYSRVLSIEPAHVEALQMLAGVLAQEGDIAAALGLLDKAIVLRPADPDLRFRLGFVLEQAGRTDDAFVGYRNALALRPDHPGAQRMGMRLLAQRVAAEPAAYRAPPADSGPAAGQDAPMISVVMCSIDADKFAAASANYGKLLAGWRHEIIGIHDARSLCEGYNRGARQAQGEIIVFSHDDIEILSADFAPTLTRLLRDHAVVGVAGATHFPVEGAWFKPGWPYLHGQIVYYVREDAQYAVKVFGVGGAVAAGIQVLDGVFMAVRREVLETLCFDAGTFDGFHFYDIDFTYRAYCAGFGIAVSNEIVIVHRSSGSFGDEWKRYAERFQAKHRARAPELAPCYWGGAVVRLHTSQQVVAFVRALTVSAEAALAEAGQPSAG